MRGLGCATSWQEGGRAGAGSCGKGGCGGDGGGGSLRRGILRLGLNGGVGAGVGAVLMAFCCC